MRRLFKLLILCCASIAAITCSYELLRRYDVAQGNALEESPLVQAEALIQQRQWQEAKLIGEFVATRPDLGHPDEAALVVATAEAGLSSLPEQARSFLQGAISGEPDNGPSFLGAMALDLFVIGDIRDLLVQGYKKYNDDSGDDIILALSAAGLGLALLPNLHWVPSLMKGLKRTGSLSDPFLKSFGKVSRTALKTNNFKPMAKTLGDVGKLTKNMGMGPMRTTMKAARSSDDVAKLALAAEKNAGKTYVLTSVKGTKGVGKISKSAGNLAKLTSKLRLVSRLAKISKKGFAVVPSNFLAGLLLLTLLMCSYIINRSWARRIA